jgi:hypothetical protein
VRRMPGGSSANAYCREQAYIPQACIPGRKLRGRLTMTTRAFRMSGRMHAAGGVGVGGGGGAEASKGCTHLLDAPVARRVACNRLYACCAWFCQQLQF